MAEDLTYLPKLRRFEDLYNDRVATAMSLLGADPRAVVEIETSRDIVGAAIQELADLYRGLFIDESAAKNAESVLRLTRLEANIAMTAQQTLTAMRKLIALQSRPGAIKALRSGALRNSIHKINASLARRDDAAPLSPVVAVPEMLLAARKPVKTAFLVVALVGLHRSVSHWPRWLDPANFFRTDDLTFAGFDEANSAMAGSPRRVMVVVGNHDASLYDGSIANRSAHKLGTAHHIVMARRGVYPIPPPESPGDVVYVDEYDASLNPIGQSVDRVKEFLAKRDIVSIAVYPEGMMPFSGAQMPLVAKEGAFIVARKIAIALAEQQVPVYLVELKSNMIEHLTHSAYVEPEVRVTSVEIVPAEPMVKGKTDEWIARRRLQSQELYNTERGENMIDIVASARVPGAKTFEARGLLRDSPVR